jgi:hypothetical protein
MNSHVQQAAPSALSILQDHFCWIKLSNQIRIIERHEAQMILDGQALGEICFFEKKDGELLMKRLLESQPIFHDVKKTIADFWTHPKTHMYTNIAFAPWATPPTTLNYWVGSLVKPVQGDWEVIKVHIKNVICNGDLELYEYLLNYLAHMIQYPEDKPGVMVVLLGKQGTGKGLFFEILKRIWPRSTLLVSDIQQVVGQFNAALERNYVIIMDEALFSGDRRSQDRMKSLITEKSCHVEQKYQPSRTIDSVHRFFASSNHDQFAHIEADDRRYLFFRVSAKHQGNHFYFERLSKAIDSDTVIAAMAFELKNRNITGFNVRQRPITNEHNKQKLMSLEGFDRYWFEVLTAGRLSYSTYLGTSQENYWTDSEFVATTALLDFFQKHDKYSQKFKQTNSKDISDAISRLCPSAKKDRQASNRAIKRGFLLPDLSIARQEFEHAYNLTIDWDDLSTDLDDSAVIEMDSPIWESELATFAMSCHVTWQPIPE